ncbi:hypothetical protein C8J35_10782 [Rhizobium sp. PP-F2F-G38]|nr:hypothetical protein C8J37_10781 [Rhizobium sp. PP-WC-1G-195]PYE95923.1 hypothetical protein C8J35_10782 [Rhizobium sp. PP-F2F-G38]TCP88472.1 hypothetical protein C8J31_103325 [Rhizobium sp. PP-CC-2G-626]TCQ22863.1 hypothetical protein C8J33_10582 [Rhizobium sp. PP-CC-3G-465]
MVVAGGVVVGAGAGVEAAGGVTGGAGAGSGVRRTLQRTMTTMTATTAAIMVLRFNFASLVSYTNLSAKAELSKLFMKEAEYGSISAEALPDNRAVRALLAYFARNASARATKAS